MKKSSLTVKIFQEKQMLRKKQTKTFSESKTLKIVKNERNETKV